MAARSVDGRGQSRPSHEICEVVSADIHKTQDRDREGGCGKICLHVGVWRVRSHTSIHLRFRQLLTITIYSIYLDLDTECLRPYSSLLTTWNVSSAPYPWPSSQALESPSTTPSVNTTTTPTIKRKTALLARMGLDPLSEHSLPNAWLASTPSHPFWYLALNHIKEVVPPDRHRGPITTSHSHPDSYPAPAAPPPGTDNEDPDPEYTTGPVSLLETWELYREKYHDPDTYIPGRGPDLEAEMRSAGAWVGRSNGVRANGAGAEAERAPRGKGVGGQARWGKGKEGGGSTQQSEGDPAAAVVVGEQVLVLPFWTVYPFSWQRDGDGVRTLCSADEQREREGFDPQGCKDALRVVEWGSWSVTYWGHSW